MKRSLIFGKTLGYALILGSLILAFVFSVKACDRHVQETYPKGHYELSYVVYYTDSVSEVHTIVNDYPIRVYSVKGTNYVDAYNGPSFYGSPSTEIISTTAPIRVIYYKAEVDGED